MLDFNLTEMAVVAIVALLVIGPKDLPKALRVAGYWIGKARGVARQFRAGFDEMVREAELAEMEKKWQEENERIMREHGTPAKPSAALTAPVSADDAITAAPITADPVTTDPVTADPVTADADADDDQPTLPLMVERPVVRPAPEAPTENDSEPADKSLQGPSQGAAS